mmetsp:Transcript_1263/g.3331  ORF Transcript_1263/g.3331 Transcript_1263/m.3331 type:complete len:285 (-) Transcript_1263:228-1082(-)
MIKSRRAAPCPFARTGRPLSQPPPSPGSCQGAIAATTLATPSYASPCSRCAASPATCRAPPAWPPRCPCCSQSPRRPRRCQRPPPLACPCCCYCCCSTRFFSSSFFACSKSHRSPSSHSPRASFFSSSSFAFASCSPKRFFLRSFRTTCRLSCPLPACASPRLPGSRRAAIRSAQVAAESTAEPLAAAEGRRERQERAAVACRRSPCPCPYTDEAARSCCSCSAPSRCKSSAAPRSQAADSAPTACRPGRARARSSRGCPRCWQSASPAASSRARSRYHDPPSR